MNDENTSTVTMSPERIDELVNNILSLLPPEAPAEMLRPALTQNMTMIVMSYGPDQAVAFAQDIESATQAYRDGDREKCASYIEKYGMSLEMLEAMTAQAGQ